MPTKKTKKRSWESTRPPHRVITIRVPIKELEFVEKLVAREIERTHKYCSSNRLFLKLLNEEYARRFKG
jgi:hypothetical protein